METYQCSITTKAGDKGESCLYNGKRLPKSDIHFECLGSLDECNSFIGLSREFLDDTCKDVDERLEHIQCTLFSVCAAVATPLKDSRKQKLEKTSFDGKHIEDLERWSSAFDSELPEQDSFLLPSGGKAASHIHVARSICRRAERAMSLLLQNGDIEASAYEYVNRLSDFLYICARYVSMKQHIEVKKWRAA